MQGDYGKTEWGGVCQGYDYFRKGLWSDQQFDYPRKGIIMVRYFRSVDVAKGQDCGSRNKVKWQPNPPPKPARTPTSARLAHLAHITYTLGPPTVC